MSIGLHELSDPVPRIVFPGLCSRLYGSCVPGSRVPRDCVPEVVFQEVVFPWALFQELCSRACVPGVVFLGFCPRGLCNVFQKQIYYKQNRKTPR